MSHKKINFSSQTKLSESFFKNTLTPKEKLNIINKNLPSTIKSFRLRPIDLNRLQKIVQKTNNLAQTRKFNDTDLIKALLTFGETFSPEKLISYIRKSL